MLIINKEKHVCGSRFSFILDNFLRKLVQSPQKIVGQYIKTGDTVIDIGCGPGFFTVEMAKMVGETGTVIGIDLQQKMLDKVNSTLSSTELAKRVKTHKCEVGNIGLSDDVRADFILAFYMVHETGDYAAFLQDIKKHLKAGGRLLIVEPPIHVSKKKFNDIEQKALLAGFKLVDRPIKKGGKSLLLSV